MLKVVGAISRVVGGRLQVQIDLKGDLPGHPFRGNQWSGGAGGGPLSDEEKKTAHDAIDRLPVLEDFRPVSVAASDVFTETGPMAIYGSPKKKNKVVARVPLDKLVKGQFHIPVGGLHAYVDEVKNELPEVIIQNGVMHINAGHTRLAALKLAGRTHAVVHFAEYIEPQWEKGRYVDAADIVAPEGVEILDVKVKKSL